MAAVGAGRHCPDDQILRAAPAGTAGDDERMLALGDLLADIGQVAAHLPGIGPLVDMADCGPGLQAECREEIAGAAIAPNARP